MRGYETFATTADAGIRCQGRGYAEFYGNALRGLNLLLFGRNLRPGAKGDAVLFRFRGDGPENVLVNFLAAALALATQQGKQVALGEIRRADSCRLEATLLALPRRCPPKVEIKAVTYHNLRVGERNGVLRAAIVFDV